MSPHTDAGALLPCPFCGGKPYLHGPDNPGHEYWISCQSCQASSVMRSNYAAAESAWNTRQAASQGGAGGDWEHVRSALETLSDPLKIAVEGHLTGVTRSLAIINAMSSIAKTAALHVPAVKTGGEAETIEAIAKTIWLAGFNRAFSRSPTDPWENQSEITKEQHRDTARKLVEAGLCAIPKLTAAGERDRYKVDDPWYRPIAAQASPASSVVEALQIAAGRIAGMGTAAARINLFGRLSEAYGAAEVEVKQLAKQIQSGEEIEDRNGIKHQFTGVSSLPSAPAQEAKHCGVWQPIETASKDGTLILLFCDHHDGDPELRIGHYDQPPFGKPGPFGRYVWQMQDDGGCFAERIVTHWMPLPGAPSPPSADREAPGA